MCITFEFHWIGDIEILGTSTIQSLLSNGYEGFRYKYCQEV